MKTACPAKVNLRLRVFGPDATGYHGVETLLARIDLADTLGLERVDRGIEIVVTGEASEGVPPGPANLCYRAVEAFLAAAFPGRAAAPGVRLHLEKRIPAGTGLGGGSADAAAALRLLAAEWPGLEERTLIEIGGRLGSDVPFGLLDVPMALGWERGRRLLPLRPPRRRPGLLVCPPFRVATAQAYGWLDEARAGEELTGSAVLPGPARLVEWTTLGRIARNDFEPVVLRRHPELGDALARLREEAALASMTGSGPALFAVFDGPASRTSAREALAGAGYSAEAGWRSVEIELPV